MALACRELSAELVGVLGEKFDRIEEKLAFVMSTTSRILSSLEKSAVEVAMDVDTDEIRNLENCRI